MTGDRGARGSGWRGQQGPGEGPTAVLGPLPPSSLLHLWTPVGRWPRVTAIISQPVSEPPVGCWGHGPGRLLGTVPSLCPPAAGDTHFLCLATVQHAPRCHGSWRPELDALPPAPTAARAHVRPQVVSASHRMAARASPCPAFVSWVVADSAPGGPTKALPVLRLYGSLRKSGRNSKMRNVVAALTHTQKASARPPRACCTGRQSTF